MIKNDDTVGGIDVVSKLVSLKNMEMEFEKNWKNFLKDVFDKFDGVSSYPFYSIKYTNEEKVTIEMFAPVIKFNYKEAKEYTHYTYFEIFPCVSKRILGNYESKTIEVLKELEKYIVDNKYIQNTPSFYKMNIDDEENPFVDILVGYKNIEN